VRLIAHSVSPCFPKYAHSARLRFAVQPRHLPPSLRPDVETPCPRTYFLTPRVSLPARKVKDSRAPRLARRGAFPSSCCALLRRAQQNERKAHHRAAARARQKPRHRSRGSAILPGSARSVEEVALDAEQGAVNVLAGDGVGASRPAGGILLERRAEDIEVCRAGKSRIEMDPRHRSGTGLHCPGAQPSTAGNGIAIRHLAIGSAQES
jgi:hypothetical protein